MPENTPAPRPFARTLAAAAAALLLVTGGLLAAAPASAHDELVSTDPAADSTVEALPAELTLTFSGELATEAGATEMQVTDAAGTSLADGEPVVEGTTVTQALTGAASGPITVLWKVVSSDGHPISGEYGFTVSAPTTPTPTPTETPAPTASATPSDTPSAEPTETPTVAPVPADSSNAALPVDHRRAAAARRRRCGDLSAGLPRPPAARRGGAASQRRRGRVGGRCRGSAAHSAPPADR